MKIIDTKLNIVLEELDKSKPTNELFKRLNFWKGRGFINSVLLFE